MRILRHGLVFAVFFSLVALAFIKSKNDHSVSFNTEACIQPYKRYDYHTCADISASVDGEEVIVPYGFKTDLASIPRILWPLLAPQYSAFVAPAILHDYLYQCGSENRKWADEVFYSSLKAEGVSSYTAMKFYLAVRIFGAFHYQNGGSLCQTGLPQTDDLNTASRQS